MKLPPYLFCQSPELPGAGIILQTGQPQYMGRIWLFRTDDELAGFMANRPLDIWGKVNGYRVIIEGIGSLLQHGPHAYCNQNAGTLARICQQMADFYFTFKIETNASYYKRYRES